MAWLAHSAFPGALLLVLLLLMGTGTVPQALPSSQSVLVLWQSGVGTATRAAGFVVVAGGPRADLPRPGRLPRGDRPPQDPTALSARLPGPFDLRRANFLPVGAWAATMLGVLLAAAGALVLHRPTAMPIHGEREVFVLASLAGKLEPARGMGVVRRDPIDSRALLVRSEALHTELCRKFRDNSSPSGIVLREYVVSTRVKPGTQRVSDLCIWVPIATVAVAAKLEVHTDLRNEAVVASLAREIFECALLASAGLRNVARTSVEYAIEEKDSWHANVENKKRYSKTDARYADLGLEPGADVAAVRVAYRRLSFELRPESTPNDPVKAQENAVQLQRVQDAYNVLGGVYKSGLEYWYHAVRGEDRAAFSGALDLTPFSIGEPLAGSDLPLEQGGVRCAVAKLNSPVIKEIMNFNLMHVKGMF